MAKQTKKVPDELLIQKTSQLKSIKKEIQNTFTFFANWCSDQLKNSLGYDYVTKRGIKIDGYAEKSPVGYLGKRKTAAKSKVVYNGYSRFTLKRVFRRAKISSANR